MWWKTRTFAKYYSFPDFHGCKIKSSEKIFFPFPKFTYQLKENMCTVVN